MTEPNKTIPQLLEEYTQELGERGLEIHRLVVDRLLERLAKADVATGDLQTAIKFLKDNGFDVNIVVASTQRPQQMPDVDPSKFAFRPEEPGLRPAKKA